MRTIRNAALAGAAAVLLCGAFNIASANNKATHVLTVGLPGGAVEQIRYTGDVPPNVVIDTEARPFEESWPVSLDDPERFLALDRISAAMDRDMAAAMRQIDAMESQELLGPQGLSGIDAARWPAGSESYSFVSTTGGNMFCARSVEITSRGENQKPRVVSKTYGNCGHAGAAAGAGARNRAETAARQDAARSIRYVRPSANQMLHEISDEQ